MLNNPQTQGVTERPSHEATGDQLQLAKGQGEAYGRALGAMAKMDDHGPAKRVGDYEVDYALEDAEGLYVFCGEKLEWREPSDANLHVEIVVRDAADGRFIPGLHVTVTLYDKTGKEIGTYLHPFLWHPWLYHYGRDWHVPGDGEYALRVRIDAPNFPRHDKTNGHRYAEQVTVEFTGVEVKTGQKKS